MSDIIVHEEQILKAEADRVTLRNNLRRQGIYCDDDETIGSLANKVANILTANKLLVNKPANLYIDETDVPADWQIIYKQTNTVFCPNAKTFEGTFREISTQHVYIENVENLYPRNYTSNQDFSYNSNLQELIIPKNINKNMTGSISTGTLKYCILPNTAPAYMFYNANSSIKIVDIYNATSSLFRAGATGLELLIIRDKNAVVPLTNSGYVPNNTQIYVYEDILEGYKTATNWSIHASNINKIEGTIYEDIYWYKDTDWYANYLQVFKDAFGEDIFDEEEEE